MNTSVMSKLKGVLTAVFALVVALAVAPLAAQAAPANPQPAFMNGTFAVTAQPGDRVDIYQVVKGTYNDDNSITYGFANPTEDGTYAGLTWAQYNDADADKAANAQKIAAAATAAGDPTATATADTQGTATFTDVAAGQYLVLVYPKALGRVYQPIIQTVAPSANANNSFDAPKATFTVTNAKYVEFGTPLVRACSPRACGTARPTWRRRIPLPLVRRPGSRFPPRCRPTSPLTACSR